MGNNPWYLGKFEESFSTCSKQHVVQEKLARSRNTSRQSSNSCLRTLKDFRKGLEDLVSDDDNHQVGNTISKMPLVNELIDF